VDIIQKDLDVKLDFTPDRGQGLFALRNFRMGELVLSATGEVVSKQTEHSIQIGWDRHLEPRPLARFINHSCDPNLGVKTNKHGFPDFVAMRAITMGEELTFDYAMTEYRHYERDDPALEFDLTCHCGSVICRGKLGYYSELPHELKEKYAGFISDYLLRP
jgi:uncharacterized protein